MCAGGSRRSEPEELRILPFALLLGCSTRQDKTYAAIARQFSSDLLLFPFVLSYTRWSEAYAGRALMRWIHLGTMVPQSFSLMQESRRRLTVCRKHDHLCAQVGQQGLPGGRFLLDPYRPSALIPTAPLP
jgi:hypothetical protein